MNNVPVCQMELLGSYLGFWALNSGENFYDKETCIGSIYNDKPPNWSTQAL